MESIERGDITQSSFAFRTIDDEWTRTQDGYPLRTLTQVSLHNGDVSPVTYPAYEDTDIAARAVARAALRDGVPAEELVQAIKTGLLPGEVRAAEEIEEEPVADVPEVDLTALRMALLARRIAPGA
jgi:hypothetical protein